MENNVTNFSEGLKRELKKQNLTLKNLSEMTDIPYDTLKKIYQGKTKNPSLDVIIKIMKALKCSLISLLNMSSVNEEFIDISSLSKRTKDIIKLIIEFEKGPKNTSSPFYIPKFTPTGYMRDGMSYDSSTITKLDVSKYKDIYGDKLYIAIEITSDDFLPLYSKGDTLLISKDRHPNFGEICIYFHKNVFYLRRLTFENPPLLEPINNYGTTIEVKRSGEWSFLGYVLCVYR